MNKIISFLLFAAVAGYSSQFYNGTGDRRDIAEVINEPYISKMVFDVVVDTQDTQYSKAFDIAKLPLEVAPDSGGVLVENFDGGAVTYSCYDADDETGTDSVNVTIIIQGSDYAADGTNPYKAKSDTWATIASETITAASAAGAITEASETFTVSDEAVRYVRWSIANNSTEAINNQPRCRGYWTRRARN
jgi:hypothetical protein